MIVNLTPHILNIHTANGMVVEVPPSGKVARCAVNSTEVSAHDGVPLFRSTMGDIQDLPDPQSGTIFVVSMVVRSAVPDRSDVASPGVLVRNEQGQPIGCQGLVVN